MSLAEDMSVFFDVDGFALPVTRQRPAAADLAFAGILGTFDEDALQGHVLAAHTQLCFAAADVAEGDTLLIAAAAYTVLRVERIVDGAEMLAWLAPAA